MGAFILLQAIFGILTLVWHVPLSVALVHQGFAVIVLAATVDHLAVLKGAYQIRG